MQSSSYIEVQPERDVTGANFPKGQINFNWTMDNSSYFNPYKSFIKIRCTLKKSAAAQLAKTDATAPNQYLAAQLFQQLRMNVNNMTISEIGDYVPQIEALKNRMYKSSEHQKNYLAYTNFGSSFFNERRNDVIADGLPVTSGPGTIPVDPIIWNRFQDRNKAIIELIWRPTLGFFDIDEYIPGCQGLWNLQLTPLPTTIFERAAVQGDGANKIPNTDYIFSIESMQMYLLKGKGPPVSSKTISLRYKECRLQTQNLTTNTLHQKTFQVHPRTQELTLAYQFSGASIEENQFSAAKFKANGSDELKILRFWIQYGGKQLPTPIPDPQFTTTGALQIDYLVQRWVETLNYTNALNSPESLIHWIENGPYYHFSGYSEDEQDDRVHVSSQFSAFTAAAIQPNVLLFDHWVKKVEIHIENARISHVKAY